MSFKALIVDDEKAVQGVLARFLQQYARERGLDADIHTLQNPVEALFELTTAGEHYDIILLDVRLPKMGGDEIYHAIEQVHSDILNRILFVTGFPEDLHRNLPQQRLRILQKPFRYRQLAEMLDEMVESKRETPA
ncbi:MAG: response regulator [Zetaproteobacteria bacterium]|nr:MAG: response regulator [Zetaproteobacteria bacterium]